MNNQIDGRLKVFVSSCIGECKTERKTAKVAITSLNHYPIIFEEIGASPHPPRQVYYEKLIASNIFIGIYRESYGWIGPNMSISGIEDEFRLATDNGMDRLIYIYKNPANRDEKLDNLLKEIEANGDINYALYSDLEELHNLIQENITALITERFLVAKDLIESPDEDPSVVVNSLLPSGGQEYSRPELINIITSCFVKGHVRLSGPMGAGKTFLLAQFARDNDCFFARMREMSPKESLSIVANILRKKGHLPTISFATIEQTIQDIKLQWSSVGEITIVLDDCDHISYILEAIAKFEASKTKNRLVFSTRFDSRLFHVKEVPVPALTKFEIESLIFKQSGKKPDAGHIAELEKISGGNPLYLRWNLDSDIPENLGELTAYELRSFSLLSMKAREIVNFLAISPTPLESGDLSTLLSEPALGIEGLLDLLKEANHLLEEGKRGWQLFHRHLKETITSELQRSSTKFGFYSNQLGRYLIRRKRYLDAFTVLDSAGDPIADKFLEKAYIDSVVRGDLIKGKAVMLRRLAKAEKGEDQLTFLNLILSLAELRSMLGEKAEAATLLDKAKSVADLLDDPMVRNVVEERKLLHEARFGNRRLAVEGMEKLKSNYLGKDGKWYLAQLSLGLSAEYIRLDDFEKAIKESKLALCLFKEIGDDYGQRLSERNFISAGLSSGDPEVKQQAEKRLFEIKGEINFEFPPRERAWLLNALARKSREEDQPKKAIEYSMEAIDIAKELGDPTLEAMNSLNCANALRDMGEEDDALKYYENTATIGATKNVCASEIMATRMIAEIYYNKKDYGKAEHYSRYAAGLSRTKGNHVQFALAQEVLADTLLIKDKVKAAEAYIEGASTLIDYPEESDIANRLTYLGLEILVERGKRDLYLDAIDKLFTISINESLKKIKSFSYYTNALCLRFPMLMTSHKNIDIVSLFGLHSRLTFDNIPKPVSRHLVHHLLSELLSQPITPDIKKDILLGIVTILTSVPSSTLQIWDTATIAKVIGEKVDGLYFHSNLDGSGHWTLNIDLNRLVTVTISQIDDQPDISLAAIILVLALKALERDIKDDLLGAQAVSRREVDIRIGSHADMIEGAPETIKFFGEQQEDVCVIPRPVDFNDENPVPMMIICANDILSRMKAGYGRGSGLQLLLGPTLLELMMHLLKGDIEQEVLRPKLVAVVRRTVS